MCRLCRLSINWMIEDSAAEDDEMLIMLLIFISYASGSERYIIK